ncbi:MAG TPA: hypothetical protein VN317_06145 [Candidatus Methanoperedens sp.]|nr:hypothetical protein [Candidatus Methanoperedens sp.]
MKKFMTIILAAALVFAFAGQASAALETSGEFRARYWYLSDYNFAAGNTVDTTNDFWDQRLRLNMLWKVSDTVKVGARADILENIWNTDKPDASVDKVAGEIDFDQAFAAFDIAPLTVTVGKQDVSLGPGLYAKADNRYRIKAGTKFDTVAVGLSYDVFTDDMETRSTSDDHGWSLGVAMPVAGWNLGVTGVYRLQGQDPAVDKSIMGLNVFATGALGPAKVVAEAMYAAGEDDYKDNSKDQDKNGILAYLGAFLPAGPANVGLEAAYAAGDDPGTKDNEGALVGDYQGPFNSFILFNNFDLNGWVSNFGTDVGVKNALALKASGTFAATKQLSFMGAVVYAMADQENAAGDDDMGFEVDALAKYAVNENVTAQVGLGYLAAGDYFGNNVDDPIVGTVQFVVAF